MPRNIKDKKALRKVAEYLLKGLKGHEIAKVMVAHKGTVYRWIKYLKRGRKAVDKVFLRNVARGDKIEL